MSDSPGPNVPFPPMEAELVAELPCGGGWRYEPKWDGFRGVLENDNGELALWSRNGRPLLRYFPELREVGDALPPHSALDGEIVIARGGALDFDAMQMRLHPAESRVRKLSAEIPATFVAFDLLLWKGKPVHEKPIEKRRAELEKVAAGRSSSRPSPTTSSRDATWLQTLQAAGFDGVIAKKLGLPYLPGSRDGVVKVKPHKTADCVVAGIRWKKGGRDTIATLLLGLYGDEGELHYVGSAAVGAKNQAEIAAKVLPLLDTKSDRRFSEPNRWGTDGLEEAPLKPKLVVEVRFDKLEKHRFRHGTRLLRFRPDKDPAQCTWREVRPPRRASDLAVEDLLELAPESQSDERNDVRNARDRTELHVRRPVSPVRPLPHRHRDHADDQDEPGHERRAVVEPLPVLVAPVAAQPPDRLAAAAERELRGASPPSARSESGPSRRSPPILQRHQTRDAEAEREQRGMNHRG